jgi:hypothetical protein
LLSVDHLVYGVADLEAACADLEVRLGVRATPGGQHPGRGTRNALIAIGPKSYLEIIGPDPSQATQPQWFGLADLTSPRLITWAARVENLGHFVTDATNAGVELGPLRSGNRQKPDGTILSWSLTDPRLGPGDGLVPFFIEWQSSSHPSIDAAQGPDLIDLRGEHPDPEHVQTLLVRLGIELPISLAEKPALVATFRNAKVQFELR